MMLAFAVRIRTYLNCFFILGHPVLGWIIPGTIFVLSFVLTWMIYRHFSRKL